MRRGEGNTNPRRIHHGPHTAKINHPPPIGNEQVRESLYHPYHTPHIRLVDLLRVFQVRVQQGDGIPRSGVIDQHIQPVALLLHGVDGGGDGGRRCHVELQEGDVGEGGQRRGDFSG